MKKRFQKAVTLTLACCITLSLLPCAAGASAQNEPVRPSGSMRLLESLRPLQTVASVMNTTAHPDDEHSAMLAYLSLGQGVSTSICAITKGNGGQNEIGAESGTAMGVLRTAEYRQALDVLNVDLYNIIQEYDDNCQDFGFSKTWEEAFELWDTDMVTERMTRYLREVRPDVVFPSFLNVRSEHGHHQALFEITRTAVEYASDPTKYPDQIAQGLEPWTVKKYYLRGSEALNTLAVDVGTYDEKYGMTYNQLGNESRLFHACQGMGGTVYPGSLLNYYTLTLPAPKAGLKETGMFDGIAYSFTDLANEIKAAGAPELHAQIAKLQTMADSAVAAWAKPAEAAQQVSNMKRAVTEVIRAAEASKLAEAVKNDLTFRMERKLEQLNTAAAACLSLETSVIPTTWQVVPGEQFHVSVRVYKGSAQDISGLNVALRAPEGFTVGAPEVKGALGGDSLIYTYPVGVPATAALYHPYRDPILSAEVSYTYWGTAFQAHAIPEEQMAVLPEFSVKFSPELLPLNTLDPKPFTVKVEVMSNSAAPAAGVLALNLPQGFTAEPASVSVSLAKKGESKSFSFVVTPPAGLEEGRYKLGAAIQGKALKSTQTVQEIDYQHIQKSYYLYDASATVSAFPLKLKEGLKVGYISAGFDTIDQTLRDLGLDVTNLSENEVRYGDLSGYDTIIVGIRAYLKRDDLVEANGRLNEYAKQGGNLIVQYHKPNERYKGETMAPLPFTIGSPSLDWRVTREDGPVTILDPKHPFLSGPNVITDADFQNWVQERALYIPSKWDSKYETILNIADPDANFDGSILTMPYGEGRYTYSSIVWFREVPNLVPGGVKLFINMISAT